jgi:SAM-dependent methyltransferase
VYAHFAGRCDWRMMAPPITFACPRCREELGPELVCVGCGQRYGQLDGIYHFLLPERAEALAHFMEQYRRVRAHDGYRPRPGDYYRALPFTPDHDPQAPIWRVRAATFAAFVRRARLAPTSASPGMDVLDLGAGNGWLCHRLSTLGHRCTAVDLLDDADDGLGALAHYPTASTRVQADFDCLPFRPGQFDRVVYNGALHYAASIEGSLRHGLSMLRPGGMLAILDSPTFHSEDSAVKMVASQAQRHQEAAAAQESHGAGQGYLLADELMEIGERLGIRLRYWPTRAGLAWSLRRWLAGIRLRREPAGFGLWLGPEGLN